MSEEARRQVSLSATTCKRLLSIRHPGQSYDGIITELIDLNDETDGRKKSNVIPSTPTVVEDTANKG